MPTLGSTDPAQDPAYLAFMRQQQVGEDLARSDAARRQSALSRQLANALPGYADQEAQGLKQIAGSAESNGVWRSGQRLTDQQDFSTQAGRQRNQFTSGISDEQANVEADLARQIAELRRQAAEQALNSRVGVVLNNAGVGLS